MIQKIAVVGVRFLCSCILLAFLSLVLENGKLLLTFKSGLELRVAVNAAVRRAL